MGGLRLRTKFLLSMVAVTAALTFTTLLVVRHTVRQEVRLEIQRDLQNSVSALRNFQKQREVTLERSAALLADLPASIPRLVELLGDRSAESTDVSQMLQALPPLTSTLRYGDVRHTDTAALASGVADRSRVGRR